MLLYTFFEQNFVSNFSACVYVGINVGLCKTLMKQKFLTLFFTPYCYVAINQ